MMANSNIGDRLDTILGSTGVQGVDRFGFDTAMPLNRC